jgi:hypothetical protein
MAYNNLNEALAALNAIGSSGDALKADLLGLVRQVSVHAEGAVTLRYSGKASGWNGAQIVEEMLDGGRDIRVLDKTVASELVSSYAFRGTVAEAFGITLFDLDTKTSAAKDALDWLDHPTDGPWADASGRFAAASSGDVRIIAPEGPAGRILADTELPAALASPTVTHIDGIPKEQLLAYEGAYGKQGLKDLIFDHSLFRTRLSGLISGDFDRYHRRIGVARGSDGLHARPARGERIDERVLLGARGEQIAVTGRFDSPENRRGQ